MLSRWRRRADGLSASSGWSVRIASVLVFGVVLLAISAAVPVLAAENPSPPGEIELPPTPEGFDPSRLPGPEDITKGIEEAEREEDERLAWLQSPQAAQERAASRLAYVDLGATEAKDLIGTAFAEELAQLNRDPVRALSDAQLISSSEEMSATIKDEGDGMVLESSLPVRTEDEQGDLRKVDVSLEETAGGYETENALVDVQIPESVDEPIEVGEEGVAIKLAGADEDQLARPFGDENVFASEVLPDTDMMISPIGTGVEIFNFLRSVNSPETLRFQVSMPAGAELHDGTWGAEVVKDGETLTTIPEPVAVDAQGTDVPVELEVDADSLVLTVEHRDGDYAWPILVDPILEYEEGWIVGGNYDTLGFWSYTTNAQGIYGSTKCIYECFGPLGKDSRGLYVSLESKTYSPEKWGQFAYYTPNIHSYLKDVSLGFPYVHADHGCEEAKYPNPKNYFGIWSMNQSNWAYLSINSANQPGGIFMLPQWGNGAIFGLTTGGQNLSMPCWRDLYAGGANIWLDDWAAPSIQSMGNVPNGWISSTTPVNITAQFNDQGLGVQNALIWGEGSGPVLDLPEQNQCSGTWRSLCWTSYTANFGNNGLTGASFREGIRQGYVNAYDATGKYAGATWFETRVDGTAPEVTLEGQLAKATNEVGSEEAPPGSGDQLTLPVYNLRIEAKDGTYVSPQDMRSGVKDIEIFLDDVKQEVPWSPTPSCPASCQRTETYQLKLSKLDTAGKHKLKVIVRDFVGHVRERNIEFEYFPATGMKDEYVMQYFPLPDGTGNEAEEEHPQRPELAVNVMNGNLVYRETDVDVEGASALDLEVERYYNSMLPSGENSEWGDGWTLAQTPELDPVGVGATEAAVVDTNSVIDGVALPTQAGASKFDPDLQATITKTASGGYEMTDETGESVGSIAFDPTGQAESLQSDGYAEVDYDYEGGKLSEIEVSDPATFSADPSELEIPEPQLITQPTYVSSFGSQGSGDGQLQSPLDAAIDSQGNFWVLDYGNHRIEKFDPSGNFLAKIGSFGNGNGQINQATSIAVAPNGDLLVADAGNQRVERFNSSGAFISKFGSLGTGNGQFIWPRGIAVDAAGNVWVADLGHGLQKFNAAGAFLQSVGTKGSGAGQLGEPSGVAVAPSGNVLVADWQNNRISTFSAGGSFLSSFGTTGPGDGQLKNPAELEVDKLGNVWVADQGNNRVQQFDLSGQFKAKIGPFGRPDGMATDSEGHLWVTDFGKNHIEQWLVPIERPAYMSAFGSVGSGDGNLQSPGDVAAGIDGSLWVADKSNNRIQHFDSSGKFLAKFGTLGSADGQFNKPTAIAIDHDGNLLVTDSNNNRVQKFSPEGQFISKFGTAGTGNGQLSSPEGIVADLQGNIWVSDSGNGRIQRFDEEGKFLAVVGSKGSGSGQLGRPIGIDVDPNGNLWVADLQNHRVSVFQPSGSWAAQFGSLGSGNGQFNRPSTVEVDSHGNVWVGDQNNNRVQRFDLQGNYVGQFGSKGSGEGQFSLPTGTTPMGIASTPSGAIWVTDVSNHRIQRWQLGTYEVADPKPLDLNDGDPSVEVETTGGLVSSVAGDAAGTHTYVHSGDDLTAEIGPGGESKYQYDATGRMTKVTLANGTWGSIAYSPDGRVQSVTVDPAGTAPAKKTDFEYQDAPSRRTTVIPSDAPHITYDIGEDGGVFKWWDTAAPPTIEPLMGTLFDAKEQMVISAGDYYLTARAYSPEGIASIDIIVNGNVLVDEMNCEQDPNKPGLECVSPPPVNEWVMETGQFAPGILWVEVLVTDRIGATAAQRFWVNIPPPPPPSIGAPVPPKFNEIKRFREQNGLEVVFPVVSEVELDERIFNLIGAWHNPHSPAGEVARASWERWGMPLRPQDVAEMEYREWYIAVNGPRIDDWGYGHYPNSYAGYEVDHQAGGITRIGFTEDQAARVEELITSADLVASDRIAPFNQQPTESRLSLEAREPSVMSAVEGDPILQSVVTEVGVADGSNALVVGTTNVPLTEQRLGQDLGSLSGLAFEGVSEGSMHESGRNKASGQMLAGDRFINWWEDGTKTACTAAFGAVKRTGDVTRRYFLSAGHCGHVGDQVFRTDSGVVDPEFIDRLQLRALGEVAKNAYWYAPYVDTEAVRLLGDGSIAPHAIFGNDGERPQIGAPMAAKRGQRLCVSGSRSNRVRCGEVVGIKHVYFEDVGRWQGAVRVDHFSTIPGDSGAPVWDAKTGAAVGILMGGRRGAEVKEVQPLLNTPTGRETAILGALSHHEFNDLILIRDH